MAVCQRCATDTPVPAHVTVGRVRCRSCGESVEIAEKPVPRVASEAPVVVRARMPRGDSRLSPDGQASGPPRATSAGLQRTCPACNLQFPAAVSYTHLTLPTILRV